MPRILFLAAILICSSAFGWHDEGHYYIARAAVDALPDDMPAFFRAGRDTIAHCALDPDVVRSRDLPQLRDAAGPEHYIDLEYFKDHPLPPTRSQYIDLCQQLDLKPSRTGTLPYAIAEQAQWLTMAFAEHRRWPNNPHIKIKCLVLAGVLAHDTGDLHMPLHTTVHHNGKMKRDSAGRFVPAGPRADLHARVDALPTKIPYANLFAQPLTLPQPRPDLFAYVLDQLTASHALVERVYELEPSIPPADDLAPLDPAVSDFTIERVRAAATFTAGIYLSAWRNSATIQPPPWLDRTIFDDHFDPTQIPPQPTE